MKTQIYDTAVVIVCLWMSECVARVVGDGVGGHNMSLFRKSMKNKQGRIGSGV